MDALRRDNFIFLSKALSTIGTFKTLLRFYTLISKFTKKIFVDPTLHLERLNENCPDTWFVPTNPFKSFSMFFINDTTTTRYLLLCHEWSSSFVVSKYCSKVTVELFVAGSQFPSYKLVLNNLLRYRTQKFRHHGFIVSSTSALPVLVADLSTS